MLQFYRKIRFKMEDVKHYIWRKKLTQTDFTIISNNCWGGTISQYLGLQYNSPTVGCLFFPKDYLKFCSNLNDYLNKELTFIELKDSNMGNKFLSQDIKSDFPVGKLGDIEIYFMHYSSQEEAFEKWNRRKKRINWDKILLKLSEREGVTEEQLREFSKLPYSKIIYTKKRYDNLDNMIYTPGLEKADRIGVSEVGLTLKSSNIVKLLNSIGVERV